MTQLRCNQQQASLLLSQSSLSSLDGAKWGQGRAGHPRAHASFGEMRFLKAQPRIVISLIKPAVLLPLDIV